ncbi:MAG: sigma 54-interacting transcriptional regulator [Muribaculum sp.]|nr:sigma 54-interacting transcriptional regulator [Muribaculum sp.]
MNSIKKDPYPASSGTNPAPYDAILYSSSYVRSQELGEQMKAIGANVQVLSDMSVAKQKIEEEKRGFLIADVSGFDPAGVNMLNWFNSHIHNRKVKSLGIITSAATLIPKCTYHINYDNSFTVGDITFDEIASVLLSMYGTGGGTSSKWLKTASTNYHQAHHALVTGKEEGKVVLLLGEAGVGRDAFAQIAHEMGDRKDHKFVYVDCRLHSGEKHIKLTTAKSRTVVERNLQGLLAEAEGGTLYFHEATLLPKDVQNILANVILRNKYREPGTNKLQKFTGLTIVSVTGSNSNALSADLRRVVNPITLRIPSLSKCKDDIVPLAEYFLSHFCMKEHIRPMKLSNKAKDMLIKHEWEGNIRELFAVITRGAQVSDKRTISDKDLNLTDVMDEKSTKRPVTKKARLKKALKEAKGSKARAARILGTTRTSIYRWMKEFDIPANYPDNEIEETDN